jgi:hypothetical protein
MKFPADGKSRWKHNRHGVSGQSFDDPHGRFAMLNSSYAQAVVSENCGACTGDVGLGAVRFLIISGVTL